MIARLLFPAFLLLLPGGPPLIGQDGPWRMQIEPGIPQESADQVRSLLEKARALYDSEWNCGVPRFVRVHVYRTAASFRKATDQPWYRAALWDGYSLHVQNPRLLRKRNQLETTLLHEGAHIALQARWGNTLPAWFEEGFAVYNSGEIATLPLPRKQYAALDQITHDRYRIRGSKAEQRWYASVGALLFILIRQHGKEPVKRILDRKSGRGFEQQLSAVLDVPFPVFEKDLLEEYNFRVRKRRIPY